MLLSNDATAVVLTPPVYAAAVPRGDAATLSVCLRIIANAASFVLPFQSRELGDLRWPETDLTSSSRNSACRPSLRSPRPTSLFAGAAKTLRSERIACQVPRPELNRGGRMTAGGLGATAIAHPLLDLRLRLGLPTFVCGCVTATIVLVSPVVRRG